MKGQFGHTSVLVYNACEFVNQELTSTPVDAIEKANRSNLSGAVYATRAAAQQMTERGSGTILLVGNVLARHGAGKMNLSDWPADFSENMALTSMGQASLSGFSASVSRELGTKGIHVAHVVVEGSVKDTKVPAMNPNSVADAFMFLHQQEKGGWTTEMDLRPSTESF